MIALQLTLHEEHLATLHPYSEIHMRLPWPSIITRPECIEPFIQHYGRCQSDPDTSHCRRHQEWSWKQGGGHLEDKPVKCLTAQKRKQWPEMKRDFHSFSCSVCKVGLGCRDKPSLSLSATLCTRLVFFQIASRDPLVLQSACCVEVSVSGREIAGSSSEIKAENASGNHGCCHTQNGMKHFFFIVSYDKKIFKLQIDIEPYG